MQVSITKIKPFTRLSIEFIQMPLSIICRIHFILKALTIQPFSDLSQKNRQKTACDGVLWINPAGERQGPYSCTGNRTVSGKKGKERARTNGGIPAERGGRTGEKRRKKRGLGGVRAGPGKEKRKFWKVARFLRFKKAVANLRSKRATGDRKLEVQNMAELKSPMAGKVQEINIKVGQMITEDDELFIIEAMKMENVVYGDPGVVKEIFVKVGDKVEEDDPLAVIE
jgi:acetyl-CoA carboxylase biotin carboxyl carrier protein